MATRISAIAQPSVLSAAAAMLAVAAEQAGNLPEAVAEGRGKAQGHPRRARTVTGPGTGPRRPDRGRTRAICGRVIGCGSVPAIG